MNTGRNVKIFVRRGEERLGPFSLEEVRAKLEIGEFGVDDQAWHAGLSGWSSLGQIMLSSGFFAKAPVKDSKSGIISVVLAVVSIVILIITVFVFIQFESKKTEEGRNLIIGWLFTGFVLSSVQGVIFGIKGCKAQNKGWTITGLIANGLILFIAAGIFVLGICAG